LEKRISAAAPGGIVEITRDDLRDLIAAQKLAKKPQTSAAETQISASEELSLRPRTQSAKPVAHVFPGRKPDLHKAVRAINRNMLMEYADMVGALDRIEELESEVSELRHRTVDLRRTHRQRMADLWSRQDAMREEIQAHVARIQELQEALEGVQKRLKELELNGNGERG
jgi:DNA repair exonuclease SbcCD ATPase subunit